jgi:hypothetical protein
MNNSSRIPLYMQNPALIKATGAQQNPSFESFRAHETYKPNYKTQGDDRPNTHMMSVIRRNPDGTLDYQWAKNMVLDAIHKMSTPADLRPIHQALLTVVFPDKFKNMEPMQAEISTQFSATEKAAVRELVEAQLKEERNWNAGQGGSAVDGMSQTRI